MKLLLETALNGGFVLDGLGVIGLGMLGMAAARLARREKSWGGSLMGFGAVLLLVGRLWVLLSPSFLTPSVQKACGPPVMALLAFLPTILMTAGLAGVVWGLWGHEKWMKEEAALEGSRR